MHTKTLSELTVLLHSKQISATELAQHYLKRIDGSDLNAFVHVDAAQTLKQAQAADALLAQPDAPALAGLPIAHKDIFVTQHWRSTAGSKMLANYTSPFDATVVSRMAAAGMVTLGKLNCDEFAMGSANQNSYFGAVRNPWDKTAVPGGSSGGSAAAVAARLAPAATGTDTGGSIRQPAAFCGVTGIKPTYGRVSRFGMIAFASSLDQGGPMAQTAEDCALLLNAMAGFDERDSTSLPHPVEDFKRDLNTPLTGLKIGVPREFFAQGLAPDVEAAVKAALAKYQELGAVLVDISLPKTELSIPVYYVIAPAEASSNLSRFDGVRYGHRAANYDGLSDMYKQTRTEGFGDEVKRRILVGSYVLSHGYYDAYYLQAQKIRRLIADDLADIYTLSTSLAGLPGMSIPCGFGQGDVNKNRPVGLQLIGNYFNEAKLLGIAHQFQLATDWHKQAPAL